MTTSPHCSRASLLGAVDVCDPNGTQHEIVNTCLDAGVGVVCRTPLADDLDEATAIHDVAERGDAPVLVDTATCSHERTET